MGHFRLGVVGAGKIVRDQHVAAIAATPGLELVASADPHARLEGIPGYADLGAMLEADSGIDAVAICTPAHLRHRLARQALAAGKAVLLEKPPGATLAETRQLKAEAEARGQVLFAAWAFPLCAWHRQGAGMASRAAYRAGGHPLARGCQGLAPGPAVAVGGRRHGGVRPWDQRAVDTHLSSVGPFAAGPGRARDTGQRPDAHRGASALADLDGDSRQRRLRFSS